MQNALILCWYRRYVKKQQKAVAKAAIYTSLTLLQKTSLRYDKPKDIDELIIAMVGSFIFSVHHIS